MTSHRLWFALDKAQSQLHARKCTPFPTSQWAKRRVKDTTIILSCLQPSEKLGTVIQEWLAQGPREIIISTIDRDYDNIRRIVDALKSQPDKIRVIATAVADIRLQKVNGVGEVDSEFMLLLDDGVRPKHPATLEYLLAPFDNGNVGAVGGPQIPLIDEPDSISVFQTLSARTAYGLNGTMATRYGAGGGVTTLTGACVAVRRSLLKKKDFCEEYTNEVNFGQRRTTGDDHCLTRWIQNNGWRTVWQRHELAEVGIYTASTSRHISQLTRWSRTGYIAALNTIFGLKEPDILQLWKRHPILGGKTVSRALRPWFSVFHFGVWVYVMFTSPGIGLLFGIYNVYGYVTGYSSFLRAYPICFKHFWVMFIYDVFLKHVIDLYALLTLRTEYWDKKQAN